MHICGGTAFVVIIVVISVVSFPGERGTRSSGSHSRCSITPDIGQFWACFMYSLCFLNLIWLHNFMIYKEWSLILIYVYLFA
jgi:hypothetical protein